MTLTATPTRTIHVLPRRRRLLATALIVGAGTALGAGAIGLASDGGRRGVAPVNDTADHPIHGPVDTTTTTPATTTWTGDAKDHPNYGPVETSESVPQAVRVVADDSSWDTSGISTLEAGWVSFTMQTVDGEADHGLALLRLKGDVTVDDTLRAESLAQLEEMAEPIGGLVGLTGAASHSVTVRLVAGAYGMFDLGESEDGPNMLRGMTASFEVASGDGAAGLRPSSDGEIEMSEFAIDVPEGFTGRGTYLVRNAGGLYHELNIGRVGAGDDVVEEVRRDAETGESRITEVPGMWILGPGETAYLTLDLDNGSYVFSCNLADPEDQPAHTLHGMYTPFTVG